MASDATVAAVVLARRADDADARRRNEERTGRLMRVLPERRCQRCEHWTWPSVASAPKRYTVNPYGDCHALAVIDERSPLLGEKGTIVAQSRLDGDADQPARAFVIELQQLTSCERGSASVERSRRTHRARYASRVVVPWPKMTRVSCVGNE